MGNGNNPGHEKTGITCGKNGYWAKELLSHSLYINENASGA